MKIGIFDPYLDSLSGGEKYMLTAVRCLSKTHTVSIFWDPQKEKEIKEKALNVLGIDITHIPFTKNIFSSNVSFISRFFASRQFDAILFLSDGSLPFVASTLYVHFQSPMLWIDGNSFKTRLKVARVKQFICNSQFTKSFVDKKFGIKSTILYPPVEIKSIERKKENMILNVGRFGINWAGSSYKKQDVLIDAFKNMVDDGLKDWRFVIVMNVRQEAQKDLDCLKQMAKDYPIEFVENPVNEMLWELYSKAKIYWHAAGFGQDLEKNPDRAEHFGISTVEAMGKGAVPVVINAGGQKEIVRDGEDGFVWDSIDELQEETLKLIQNENVWKKLSQKAIERSLFFAGDRFCKESFEIIK